MQYTLLCLAVMASGWRSSIRSLFNTT